MKPSRSCPCSVPLLAAAFLLACLLAHVAHADGLPQEQSVAGDGAIAPWLGSLHTEHAPWVYHDEHGWLLLRMDEQGDGAWLYEPGRGWLWSADGVYPSLYDPGRREWLRHEGGRRGARTFHLYWADAQVAEADGVEGWLDAVIPAAVDYAAGRANSWLAALSTNQFPDYTHSGTYQWRLGNEASWISGFLPAILWRLNMLTDTGAFSAAAQARMPLVATQRFRTDSHDLGFMILLPFRLGHAVNGNPGYPGVIHDAADSLASRFSAIVGATRSWDWGDYAQGNDFTVIVDNMMNLELLLWAATNDPEGQGAYRDMAVVHADTTIRDFIRPDGGTWHVIRYDQRNGNIRSRETHQGYADDSTWSRGQAWAIHGFAVMYRETGYERFADAFRLLSAFHFDRAPADGVPYYDYDAPLSTGPARDTSAAAIAASAFIDFSRLCAGGEQEFYRAAAAHTLKALCSPRYLGLYRPEVSILVEGSRAKNAQDVGTIYGDYYFLEAIARWLGQWVE
jgi:unsaturated chondroitin disaccharide hydrolase